MLLVTGQQAATTTLGGGLEKVTAHMFPKGVDNASDFTGRYRKASLEMKTLSQTITVVVALMLVCARTSQAGLTAVVINNVSAGSHASVIAGLDTQKLDLVNRSQKPIPDMVVGAPSVTDEMSNDSADSYVGEWCAGAYFPIVAERLLSHPGSLSFGGRAADANTSLGSFCGSGMVSTETPASTNLRLGSGYHGGPKPAFSASPEAFSYVPIDGADGIALTAVASSKSSIADIGRETDHGSLYARAEPSLPGFSGAAMAMAVGGFLMLVERRRGCRSGHAVHQTQMVAN